MKEVQKIVSDFISDRPTMEENNNNPRRMAELLLEEVDEFLVEVGAGDTEKAAREAVDVVWFILSWAHLNDVDLEEEFREKAARNILKREAWRYDGRMTYEEAEKIARQYNDTDFYS